MEEFLNIDWKPPIEDIIDDVFINEERLKKESAMYKIMLGIFTDPFTELETDDSEDDENNKEMNNTNDVKEEGKKENDLTIQKPNFYVPGIMKPSFKFPRLSRLTKEQHATCLKVLLTFSNRAKPEINQKSRSELELYMNLCPTIREEQQEFLDLAKANWKGSNLKITGVEYIQQRWKSKVQKLLTLPRYYTAAGNVPFNGDKKISLNPETTLLEMGQLPRVMIPNCNGKRCMLYCNTNKLEFQYPARNSLTLDKPTVSEDLNCERLTENEDIDLVISSSGLNCLATNFGPNYNSTWMLPIVVKKTHKRNVIYIDKPLPSTAMTVPQKNTWIHKYILKSQLLHPNHRSSISLSDHQKQESADQSLFGNLYADDLLKLEEENDKFQMSHVTSELGELKSVNKLFAAQKESGAKDLKGSCDLAISETNKMETCSAENDEQNSPESISNIVNVYESSSMKEISFESKRPSDECVEARDTVLLSNLKTNTNDDANLINKEMLDGPRMEKKLHTSQDSTDNNSSPTCYAGRSNVTYRIFSIGQSAHDNTDSLNTNAETYRILVRTKVDGIEKIDKETLHPIMLIPKMEHQVALGAEAVTAEEALKQWTILTYRPNTSLARIRISAENSEVIQIERRSTISINNEIKRLYSLDVEESFVTLYNVIHYLKSFKPGNYLLRHTSSNGAFATIYQESNSSGKNVFDLHASYSQEGLQTINNVPWPALDKVVVTPSHKCFERMPAMYHPARNDKGIAFKATRGRGRGNASRGRGKIGRVSRTGDSQAPGTSVSSSRLLGVKRVRTKRGKKKNRGTKVEVEKL